MRYPAARGQTIGVAALRVTDEILGYARYALESSARSRRSMSAACPVFGFAVRVRPARGIAAEHIFESMRAVVLEPLGLVAGPGAGWSERIVAGDGCQATDGDRRAVIAWLERQAIVDGFDVSVLGDFGRAA